MGTSMAELRGASLLAGVIVVASLVHRSLRGGAG